MCEPSLSYLTLERQVKDIKLDLNYLSFLIENLSEDVETISHVGVVRDQDTSLMERRRLVYTTLLDVVSMTVKRVISLLKDLDLSISEVHSNFRHNKAQTSVLSSASAKLQMVTKKD